MPRRYLGKRQVLEDVTGKPWQETAREWDGKGNLSIATIAERWTQMVAAHPDAVTITHHDVSRWFREARKQAQP